ncbi:hypothetical protein [Mycobacterium sp.]|uniref:hypothetical protein n=1 Tax=Mycobacterium sp. TaxID=1785 RepID=UPI003342194B
MADEHDDDTDFRQSVPGLRESLIDANAEYAVGPTISEDKVNAANGVSPAKKRKFGQLPSLAVPSTFDEPLPDIEITPWEGDAR